LRIKDPSFVSLKNREYAFDFGHVSVAFLFHCNQDNPKSASKENSMCVDETLRSELKPVGIPSLNKSIDTSQAFLKEGNHSKTYLSWHLQIKIQKILINRYGCLPGRFESIHLYSQIRVKF
jgi:hypothetical protein